MDRFNQALEQIKNDNIRALTRAAMTAVSANNPWFFYAPASISGKYHPKDECERGGLVKHTLRAVAWGLEVCRAWDMG
ncbi:MAG: hypothetical protein V2L15_05390, partial [Desulfobacteraceae bacterium]|nr:hypothetical protein [Desulfobacteraceae bacterium]